MFFSLMLSLLPNDATVFDWQLLVAMGLLVISGRASRDVNVRYLLIIIPSLRLSVVSLTLGLPGSSGTCPLWLNSSQASCISLAIGIQAADALF